MGMKVVLGVGDKSLEKYITEMPEVDVLTTVRRREGIIDAIVNYNPHAVILSMALSGKADYRDILPKIKELRHKAKIVFIYGDKDDEFRYFADFLVEQGIYNFIAGAIDPYSLADVILKDYTLSDVEHYRLSREEIITSMFGRHEEAGQAKKDLALENPQYNPSVMEKPEGKTEVVFIEKIIERETVQTQVVGNIRIGIASLFERAGSTHTAIEVGKFLGKLKKDVGVLVAPEVYDAIGSFYLIEKSPLVVDGVTFYKDETEALNAHRAVIYDLGKLDDQKLQEYLKMNCKLMLCPTASWEIDRLTDFVRENIYNRKIGYLLYPVPAKYGKELVHNMQRGGCNAWMLSYNPDPFQQSDNWRVYQKTLAEIANSW